MDVETVLEVDFGSGHRLVRAKIRLEMKLERRRMVKNGKEKIHTDIDLLTKKQEHFQLELHSRFTALVDLVEEQPMDQGL